MNSLHRAEEVIEEMKNFFPSVEESKQDYILAIEQAYIHFNTAMEHLKKYFYFFNNISEHEDECNKSREEYQKNFKECHVFEEQAKEKLKIWKKKEKYYQKLHIILKEESEAYITS